MLPFARNTRSMTTSPSTLRLRPSAVYSGRGLSNMSGVVSAGPPANFLLWRFRGGRSGIAKASGDYRALLCDSTRRWNGSAVSKSRARHRAANSFFSSRSIPVAFAIRERRRTQTVHIRPMIWIALSGQAVGITKSAGLHFVDGRNHCGHCGAARTQVADLHIVFRALRSVFLDVNFGSLKRRLHVRGFDVDLFHFGCHRLGLRQVREDVRLCRVELDRFNRSRLDLRLWGHGLRLGWRWGIRGDWDFS